MQDNYAGPVYLELVKCNFDKPVSDYVADNSVPGGRYREDYTLDEWDIYGSTRLGLLQADKLVQKMTYNATNAGGTLSNPQNPATRRKPLMIANILTLV